MVKHPLRSCHAAPLSGIDGGNFPGRVSPQILTLLQRFRPLKNDLCLFDVLPDCLPGAMLPGVCPALKDPVTARLLEHLLIQPLGPCHAPGLAGLFLADGLTLFKLGSAQLQHIRHPQAGSHAQPYDERIGGHQSREYMAHLGRGGVAGTGQNAPTLLSIKCLLLVVVKIA